LDSEWCDQWDIRALTLLRKDIKTLDNEEQKELVQSLFDAAASQRILYLVDKYISDEARAKGEELMKKYDVYHPILRRKP
jgi:nitrate reductase assembly molybdenum cofactor insertion protein NarJ